MITDKLSEIKYHIENYFHAECSAFICLICLGEKT